MPDYADPKLLRPEVFIEQASIRAGLDDTGPNDFLEPLDLVCGGLRQDRMSPDGRRLLGRTIVDYLTNRLRVIDHHRHHPDLHGAPITEPIIILGLPRTGTTALSYLLDTDPRWRSLLNWEAVDSVPPPTTATLRTDSRCTDLLEFQRSVIDHIDPPPPHWEWADGPTECTFLLAQDFKAAMWESRIPYAPYREYVSRADMTSAYRYHRRALEVLQSNAPGRWVLKMPAHAYFIDAVLAEYPDARIVWTHRDPVVAVTSFMNLNAFAHRLSMGTVDHEWIADTVPGRLVEQVHRPMAALAGRDVFHVHYRDQMADPLGVMADLYEWLGEPLTDADRRRMQDWIDADPLVASRRSRYDLNDYGLEEETVRSSFTDYIDAFGV